MVHVDKDPSLSFLQRSMERSTLVTAISLSLFGLGTAQAAIINVSGGCSLVDAIVSANDDSATGSCSTGSGSDTLILQNSSIHPYSTFSTTADGVNALPSITTNITIQGNGSTIERDSGVTPEFRLFHIGVAGTLTLDKLTISNGSVSNTSTAAGRGGAILNRGNITLSNSSVSGNKAHDGGGLYNVFGSTATLDNTTILDNIASNRGGGLFNQQSSVITLSNSRVSGNSVTAGSGGGLYNFVNSVTLNNSTVSGNSAFSQGGGFHSRQSNVTLNESTLSDNVASQGGGFHSFGNSVVTLNNSTVSGNSAQSSGGGLSNAISTVFLTNSTVSSNGANTGGGISNSTGKVTLTNSTVTANTTIGAGAGFHNSSSTVTLANSIVANSLGDDCFNNNSTIVDTSSSNWFEDSSCNGVAQGDPNLGPLATNGGPTKTHLLLSGSGAIDKGNNAICSASPVNNLDQRGVKRPQGEACDIGAIELLKTGFFIFPLPNNKAVVIPI